MGHKTLIGGTSYDVSKGKVMIGGTSYGLKNGILLKDGSQYSIKLGSVEESILSPTGRSQIANNPEMMAQLCDDQALVEYILADTTRLDDMYGGSQMQTFATCANVAAHFANKSAQYWKPPINYQQTIVMDNRSSNYIFLTHWEYPEEIWLSYGVNPDGTRDVVGTRDNPQCGYIQLNGSDVRVGNYVRTRDYAANVSRRWHYGNNVNMLIKYAYSSSVKTGLTDFDDNPEWDAMSINYKTI